MPVNIVGSVEKCPERNQVIDSESDVGLERIQPLLCDAVEGRLSVLDFQASENGKDAGTQNNASGEDG
jgi:hypothetical protein